ncbi:unnamed protein product, partial [Symbiodinium sp. KB8]
SVSPQGISPILHDTRSETGPTFRDSSVAMHYMGHIVTSMESGSMEPRYSSPDQNAQQTDWCVTLQRIVAQPLTMLEALTPSLASDSSETPVLRMAQQAAATLKKGLEFLEQRAAASSKSRQYAGTGFMSGWTPATADFEATAWLTRVFASPLLAAGGRWCEQVCGVEKASSDSSPPSAAFPALVKWLVTAQLNNRWQQALEELQQAQASAVPAEMASKAAHDDDVGGVSTLHEEAGALQSSK